MGSDVLGHDRLRIHRSEQPFALLAATFADLRIARPKVDELGAYFPAD
jgi:hypothetical protein